MIIQRDAVRAIVLAPGPEVLLLRIREPGTSGSFWITPGGAREAGEDVEAALRRELREELGLVDFALGAAVWRRQHTFDWVGKRLCQRELYHIVHVERFDPLMSDPYEAQVVEEMRWWPVAEVARAGLDVSPRSLVAIIERYLAAGPPAEVPDVEVLED